MDISSPDVPRVNITNVHFTFDTTQNNTEISMQWGYSNQSFRLYFFLPFQILSAQFFVGQAQGNLSQPRFIQYPGSSSWEVNATLAKNSNSLRMKLVTPDILSRGIWRDTLTLILGAGVTPSYYYGPPNLQPVLRNSERVDVTIVFPKEQFLDADTFPSPTYSFPYRDVILDTWTFPRTQFYYGIQISLITHTWTWKAPLRLPIEAQGIVLSFAFVLFAYGVSAAVGKRKRFNEKGWDPAL